jgi:endonuclease YncB( thermonuclease family)
MGQNNCCNRSDIYKINECDFENTPVFSLDNETHLAKVVDIYDGDTLTCAIFIFGKFYKFNVRLSGIDTSELQSKNYQKALQARMRLFDLVTGNKSVAMDLNLPRKNETI